MSYLPNKLEHLNLYVGDNSLGGNVENIKWLGKAMA